MLDESATWWVAGKTKLSGKYNKQDFRIFYQRFRPSSNGIKVTPSSMTAEENRVSMEADSYAELTNGKIYK